MFGHRSEFSTTHNTQCEGIVRAAFESSYFNVHTRRARKGSGIKYYKPIRDPQGVTYTVSGSPRKGMGVTFGTRC